MTHTIITCEVKNVYFIRRLVDKGQYQNKALRPTYLTKAYVVGSQKNRLNESISWLYSPAFFNNRNWTLVLIVLRGNLKNMFCLDVYNNCHLLMT